MRHEMKARCESCGVEISVAEAYHAGKGDEAFLYCDRDSTALTFCIYDEAYRRIVGRAAFPWNLTANEKEEVERLLVECPCGGRFSFKNPLRCPICGGVFSDPMKLSQSEVVIVIDRHIDGSRTQIWKQVP